MKMTKIKPAITINIRSIRIIRIIFFLFAGFFFVNLLVITNSFSQNDKTVPILHILHDAKTYFGKEVVLNGKVNFINYKNDGEENGFYIIVDNMHNIIKVKSMDLPQIDSFVSVLGIVTTVSDSLEIMLNELSKTEKNSNEKPSYNIEKITSILDYIIGILGIVVLLTVLVMVKRNPFKRKNPNKKNIVEHPIANKKNIISRIKPDIKHIGYEETQDYYGMVKVVSGQLEKGAETSFELINLFSSSGLTLGRSPENDITILSRTLSRQHLKLSLNDTNDLQVENISDSKRPVKIVSSDKSFVDIKTNDFGIVHNNYQIHIGGIILEFELV